MGVLNRHREESAPTGVVQMFAGAMAPVGWLLADGSAVSRTTYARLFAILSTTYGVGDGSTTFNLPDMRGRVAVGAGTGPSLTARSRGNTGGEETHALTTAELASHSHTQPTHTHSQKDRVGGTVGGNVAYGSNGIIDNATTSTSTGTASPTTNTSGSGTAHNVMQPFSVLNYIIKT